MRTIISFFFLFFYFNSISIADVNYLIIENQIDDEYFIAPDGLTPRFSGANKFTKYDTNQDSLGYMGSISGAFTGNYNTGDLWIDNSPVPQPFRGNRCRNGSSNCPSNGMWEAKSIRSNGAYRISQSSTTGESGNGRPILSDTFYQYLISLPVNTNNIFKINSCTAYEQDYSNDDIDCSSLSRNRVRSYDVNVTKLGNLLLKSTGALQEIFVDSNGNPTLGLGSTFCTIGFDNTGKQGIICKIVEYELKGDIISQLRLSLKINTAMLGISSVAAAEAKISGDGSNWALNYGSEIAMNNIFKSGNNGVYIFLSNSLLLKIVSSNANGSVDNSAFTFAFRNTAAPQSGFYEFTPSNYMIIKPRDYGISIIPADFNPNQSKTGKVGNEEPPIEFNYIITTSGPRQADSIIAKVDGPMTTLRGQPYCLFSSNDDTLKVPFSAYLSFKNNDGTNAKYRASCDNNEISLKNALWAETPWDKPNEDLGSYYRTNLDLSFPMNESNSYFTLDGIDWLGTVSASGSVTVKAIWTGPDIH